MPRPSNGYQNAAGQPVPGTNDVVGRFADKTALMMWAYNQGKAGRPRFERSALDIGSAVHKMAELDLLGAQDREIEKTLHDYLSAPNHLEMAHASFRAFRDWRKQCDVRPIEHEVSLVSESLQYGGTPDLVALIKNRVGIIDFKTSTGGKGPYPDQKVALRAHANLWNEANPKFRIDSYNLVILPKDGAGFRHCEFDELDREWELFRLYRQAYELDKPTTNKATQSAAKIKEAVVSAPSKAGSIDPSPKPRIRVRAQTSPQSMSMAEIMRAYGHVSEVRT
jgi:hypothetical protein